MSTKLSPRTSPLVEKKSLLETTASLKGHTGSVQYGSTSDTTTLLEPPSDSRQGRCARFWAVLATMTIEPVLFCYMFGFVMNSAILTNFMMEVGCRQNLNFSSDLCANLTGHQSEKRRVEILATDYSLYFNLVGLVGALAMVFIAPWSDRYGRKPPLLGALAGSLASDAAFILCVAYEARLEYLLLARLPSDVFGGLICVLTVIYSHASEVSTKENRTLKYTLLQLAMGLGISFGILAGGLLQLYFGYLYIYVTVGCLHAFCAVWSLLVVQETAGLDSEASWWEKLANFFESSSFRKGVEATFRKRSGSKRLLVVLLLISMCMVILMYESFGSLGFVFVHDCFDWTLTTYTTLGTVSSLAQMVVTIIAVPVFINIFKMEDFTLGIIGAVSMIASYVFMAFSPKEKILFYTGQATGVFGQLSPLAIRTILSKVVEKDEMGRVFSFLATCESVIPIVGNVAVTKLFEATLDSFPNVAYIMMVFLLLIPLFTYVWGFLNSKQLFNSTATVEEEGTTQPTNVSREGV